MSLLTPTDRAARVSHTGVSHIPEDGVNGVLGTQLLGGEIEVSTWNFRALKMMLSSTPDLPCLL